MSGNSKVGSILVEETEFLHQNRDKFVREYPIGTFSSRDENWLVVSIRRQRRLMRAFACFVQAPS